MTTVTVSNETEIKTNDFCVNNICLALRGEYPVLVFGLILSKHTSVKKNRFICVEKQDEDQEAEYKIKTYIEEDIQFQPYSIFNRYLESIEYSEIIKQYVNISRSIHIKDIHIDAVYIDFNLTKSN